MDNFSKGSEAITKKAIQEEEVLLDAFQAVANFIDSAGRSKETSQIESFILDRLQLRHGTYHPLTMSAMNNLANTLSDQGPLEKSASMQQEVLSKR